MVYSIEEKVKWSAIASRLAITSLQFFFNVLIPDHDAGVFKKPPNSLARNSSADRAVSSLLGGLSHWDSQYFLHIAEYGYTYENTLAFFPFFPLLVRQITYFLLYVINDVMGCVIPCQGIISVHSALLLTSIILNNILFIKTASILFRLGRIVLNNDKLSYISSVLFCFNPASIFFSAAYSESLYCFLVFYAVLQTELENFFLSSLLFGLSGLTRSNGVVNIGFICYAYLKLKTRRKLSWTNDIIFSVCIFLSLLPFACYQVYCYLKYCFPGSGSLPAFIRTHGIDQGFKFPGSNSSWCGNSVPFAYSYVQNHYWNVGFLRYYQWKQIPNFFLALPIFLIISCGFSRYVKAHGTEVLFLGLRETASAFGTVPISTFPYVAHCVALAIFAALVIHVQVATRLLLSSSPVPYWFSAWFVCDGLTETSEDVVARKLIAKNDICERYGNRRSRWKTFLFCGELSGNALRVKYYYIAYFVVGAAMFSNHFPWT